jgi:L-asparaginase
MTVNISLLAMGGTISTGVTPKGALPTRGADDLANVFLDGSQEIAVRTRDVLRISSRGVTPNHMWELAQAVQEEIDGGADGIVVTHGTDTLEETAYALAMLVDATVPIAVTGAMRVPATAGEDGPANVAAAMAVAQNPEFAAYGPVVVFQDEIHAARWATKFHSARVAAFTSPATGPVGIVVEDRAIALLGPSPYTERLSRTAAPTKRVELLMSLSGTDGMVVDAIADRVDGLVIAGTGGGHVPPAMTDSIIRLVKSGRPVILASRSPEPQVLTSTYGGPGGEIHLRSEGLYTAGNLSGVKARLRLIFGLSAGIPVSELFPE